MHNNKSLIKQIYEELLAKRERMNMWFNYFLDNFSEKMDDGLSKDDPIMKLYHNKMEEYSDIESNIKIAKLYLTKPYV